MGKKKTLNVGQDKKIQKKSRVLVHYEKIKYFFNKYGTH